MDTNHRTYSAVSDQCRMHLLLYHPSFYWVLISPSPSFTPHIVPLPHPTPVDGIEPRSVQFARYPQYLSSAGTTSTCRSSMSYNVENRFTLVGKLQEGMNLAASDPPPPGVHPAFISCFTSHRRASRDRLAPSIAVFPAARHPIETHGCRRGKRWFAKQNDPNNPSWP